MRTAKFEIHLGHRSKSRSIRCNWSYMESYTHQTGKEVATKRKTCLCQASRPLSC